MNGNDAEAARRLPCTCRAADRVLWFDEVDSTNTVARRLLSEMWPPVDVQAWCTPGTAIAAACPDAAVADTAVAPPIAVIVADSQTAGHGRLGRRWTSRPGESSMVSFATVLPRSLAIDPGINGWLQMIAGLAAVEAIDDVCAQVGATCAHTSCDESAARTAADADGQASCTLMLKWPNDVFVHDHKLGGILLELVLPHRDGRGTTGETAPRRDAAMSKVGVVIGIGLNLAIPSGRLPTELSTSLQLHRTPLPEPMRMRDLIAARMTAALRDRLRAFAMNPEGYSGELRKHVEPLCWTLGRPVEARLVDGGAIRGTALRLNPDASLVIRDVAGVDHTVTTGDVGVL